ncbi:hypothetical protein CDL12_12106 [Handroanthus impetiginosus]|nr:hypothetical protein CDL12_12106 [Handroanthus impetiginosus]
MEEGNPRIPSCNKQPALSPSPSMSSISGIMRKAIHFPMKNKKLMLQVFILVLIPFMMLLLLHSLIVTPLMAKVEDSYENSSMNHQDLISLVIAEIPFAFAFCLLLLFASAITILASVSTHRGESLGPKGVLLSIKY